MPVLRERKSWAAPKARRGPDLSPEEAAHVRAALAFLAVRLGGWTALAAATGVKLATLRYAAKPRGGVSAGVAIRVARAAGVPVEDVLAGAFPKPGACPRCGRS